MAVPGGSTVRWFHSEMANAPQIMAQPGDLVAILDACLVHGFDSREPDGDKISVVDGIATAHFSGGHAYDKWAAVEISGATPEELNGHWRITGVTATTFNFEAPGVPNGNASGDIVVKRATPGHWEKAFSDGHKAAYRSTHPDASGLYLRIDDSPTGTGSSQIRGYETMTDIDTGTRPFPTLAQEADLVWRRSNTTSASLLPRPWTLVADEAFIWFFVDWDSGASIPAAMYQFGDIVWLSPADVFHCVIGGNASLAPSSPGSSFHGNHFGGGQDGCYFARPMSGEIVEPPPCRRYGSHLTTAPGGGGSFPLPATGGYLFHYPVIVTEGNRNARGFLPGGMQSLTQQAATLGSDLRRVLEPSVAFPRPILLVAVSPSSASQSHFAVDIGGPWR